MMTRREVYVTVYYVNKK